MNHYIEIGTAGPEPQTLIASRHQVTLSCLLLLSTPSQLHTLFCSLPGKRGHCPHPAPAKSSPEEGSPRASPTLLQAGEGEAAGICFTNLVYSKDKRNDANMNSPSPYTVTANTSDSFSRCLKLRRRFLHSKRKISQSNENRAADVGFVFHKATMILVIGKNKAPVPIKISKKWKLSLENCISHPTAKSNESIFKQIYTSIKPF